MSDAAEETPRGWDENHWSYQCADGQHESFWQTVVTSPEWKAWSREISRRMRRLQRIDESHRKEELLCRIRKLPEPQWPDPKISVWDIDECEEAGWMSPAHFYDFVKFLRTTTARRCRDEKVAT